MEIQARLVHQPLLLRGFWRDDKLDFDSNGNLISGLRIGSFTVSGIDIDSVTLSSSNLHLHGRRVALEFSTQSLMKRVVLKVPSQALFTSTKDEMVDVDIASPSGGDYKVVLDSIFTADIGALAPTLPAYWQPFVQEHFAGVKPDNGMGGLKKVGGPVSSPKVLFEPIPEYSEEARIMRIHGHVLIAMDVNAKGEPENVCILRPHGFGLDEAAVKAARAYRFDPAMEDGKPVAVRVNLEVSFIH